jgi:hypothetical protein
MTLSAPAPAGVPLEASDEKYSASLAHDAHGLRVVFRGTISTPNPANVLNPFIDAVHQQLLDSGAPDTRVDLRELEFCNSSGFKSFIHWIHLIAETAEPQRYKLRFLSTPARKWQRTSLLALSCYGVNTVTIE